jgi:hypothetical protein
VVWTGSLPSIAIAGCGLICVGAGEEWAGKVYALRGLRGVERQVGSARGTLVASRVKCGPHGGKKSKTKSWIGAGAGKWFTTGVYTWGLRRFTTKLSGYLVEPQNQDWRLGGRRRDPGAPRSFDAGGHVAGSQGLCQEDANYGKECPCDEEECYVTMLP